MFSVGTFSTFDTFSIQVLTYFIHFVCLAKISIHLCSVLSMKCVPWTMNRWAIGIGLFSCDTNGLFHITWTNFHNSYILLSAWCIICDFGMEFNWTRILYQWINSHRIFAKDFRKKIKVEIANIWSMYHKWTRIFCLE